MFVTQCVTESALVQMRSCLFITGAWGLLLPDEMLMRMLSTRNCSGRITRTAYLSPHQPLQTLLQLFASEWICINACVMAQSGDVRYQFVCQTLVFPLFAGCFPVAPRSCQPWGWEAPANLNKCLWAWSSQVITPQHRGIQKYKSRGGSITVCPSTNDSSFLPEASFHASCTRFKLISSISDIKKMNRSFFSVNTSA